MEENPGHQTRPVWTHVADENLISFYGKLGFMEYMEKIVPVFQPDGKERKEEG
jgi:hypothetical protein